jgi:EAL domain-containing protein (putative c-di-GMP-specific phosphodiesterase class I)/GGDEF domain-containing protein
MLGEITSLLFMTVIYFYVKNLRFIPTIRNKTYELLVTIALWFVMISVSNLIFLEIEMPYQWYLASISSYLYLIASVSIISLMFLYIFTYLYESNLKFKRVVPYLFMPSYLALALIFLNPITNQVFKITESNQLIFGPQGHLALYLLVFYSIFQLGLVLFYKIQIKLDEKLALLSLPVASLIALIIQLVIPSQVMTSAAVVLPLLIIQFYIQRKDIIIDSSTNTPNQHAFLVHLKALIREEITPKIILFNVKNLADINERMGYQTSNIMLYQMVKDIQKTFSKGIIYRYSGSKYLYIANQLTDIESKALIQSLIETRNRESEQHFIINYAYLDGSYIEQNSTQFIYTIEQTYNELKLQKENNLFILDHNAFLKFQKNKRIIELLNQVIKEENLLVHYQPLYHYHGKAYLTYEALMRLKDDQLGFISPVDFIKIAEEHELIIPLGYQMLIKVGQFIQQLTKNQSPLQWVSINLSVIQLLDKEFVKNVIGICKKYNINPNQICFEITESILLDDYDTPKHVINELKKVGFVFSLDDYGTGYANLNNILALPISEIKIDKSVLYNAERSKNAYHILKSLIKGFNDIGLYTVLEGVENSKHDEMAKDLKVTATQGYFYQKPQPSDQILQNETLK